MPRFLSSALLPSCFLLCSIAGAQKAGAYSTATGSLSSPALGSAVTITAGATPRSTPAVNGSGFNTTPFSTYFGASIDPSFTNVKGLVTADLNGDGVTDLLVYGIVNTGTSSYPLKVQSFTSDGKGSFTAGMPQQLTLPAATPANVPVTSTPLAIDVNGDRKIDLLIGTAVAYGNGEGSFQQPVTVPFLSSGFAGSYAADVTGDGKLDIIAVNAIPLASLGQLANIPLQVTVFANQGSGNFRSLGTFTLGFGQYSGSVTLASLSLVDLNGDGKLDIVAQMYFVGMGNAAAPATIATLLNNGDGTFAAAQPVSYATQQNGGSIELLSVLAADFNGDGKTDLALIYPPPSQTSLTYLSPIIFLPGNNHGTFGVEVDSTISTVERAGAASTQPPDGAAVVADTNLDGALDMVFGSGAIVLGDGKGNFSPGTPVVQVPVPSIPAAFSYLNVASLGTIQPAGNAYPDLVFAAPAGTASAPFPLVAISSASPFAVHSGNPTVTVTSGQSGSVALSVVGGASYTGSVSLTCTGLPAGASCSFHPATLTLTGGAPQSSTLTVSTTGGNMAGMLESFPRAGMTTFSCGIFAGSLLLLWPKRRRAHWMMVALAGFTLLPLGCGGNSSSTSSQSGGTPAGTYNFQVVATAGMTQAATSCTLVVQ